MSLSSAGPQWGCVSWSLGAKAGYPIEERQTSWGSGQSYLAYFFFSPLHFPFINLPSQSLGPYVQLPGTSFHGASKSP